MNTTGEHSQRSPQELLKEGDPTLAGTIGRTLADPQVDHLSDEDAQFLKFHGSYQQVDRDQRKTAKQYIFMVRVRMPGGRLSPEQYLALDRLAGEYANHTLRITSRQGIQFHGILKSNLDRTIKGINDVLLTTLGACGDVVRNVVGPPSPAAGPAGEAVLSDVRRLSALFRPATPAYHEIWIDGRRQAIAEDQAREYEDPVYGRTYLPRKFKIGFALPPRNDVDLFTHCLGFIGIEEDGQLAGYNLAAGGGMGRSHGNRETFPRLADVAGFIGRHQLEVAARAVVEIHRDFGDRVNRRHARLKYVLADRGIDWFRCELEGRAGLVLQPARPFTFTEQGDVFGWHPQADGRWFLGLFIETGRIKDTEDRRVKTGLRKVIEMFQPDIRFTANNNLLLANIPADHRDEINRLLAEHGLVTADALSPLRRASMACVALPTCGLALAESERCLPGLVTRLEAIAAERGLGKEEIIVRMTGCPNGCARPYMAEIGFVGRAPGRYQIFLGGNASSTRLGWLYRDQVKETELTTVLAPLLDRFVQERNPGERFGDWCFRALDRAEPAAAPRT
jgi:sulfite reductase (NADPH) hemoprotein beta-component